MKTYEDFINGLRDLKGLGYVKAHRGNDTGIGKTLEDLLGVDENNLTGPDGELVELKSARKSSKSMVSLLTKSPLPPKVNTILVNKFGYITPTSNGKKVLHNTVNALSYNTIKGAQGFKVQVNVDKIELLHDTKAVCYWDKETLKKAFERKFPRLLFVKADSKKTSSGEEFWFNEAWLLNGFSFDGVTNLLKEGKIKVDVRIGQNPDGSGHDHGTGFRIMESNFEKCFSSRDLVL